MDVRGIELESRLRKNASEISKAQLFHVHLHTECFRGCARFLPNTMNIAERTKKDIIILSMY